MVQPDEKNLSVTCARKCLIYNFDILQSSVVQYHSIPGIAISILQRNPLASHAMLQYLLENKIGKGST